MRVIPAMRQKIEALESRDGWGTDGWTLSSGRPGNERRAGNFSFTMIASLLSGPERERHRNSPSLTPDRSIASLGGFPLSSVGALGQRDNAV